jgi:predicted nucleic acid-binding protein
MSSGFLTMNLSPCSGPRPQSQRATVGSKLRKPEPKRARLAAFVDRLRRDCHDDILPVNEAVLARWKHLLAKLKQTGQVLSCEDSLLAAHGLELGFGVATLNASHFKLTGVPCAEF